MSKKRQASITVESSIVIPFVLLVVVGMIVVSIAMLLRVELQGVVDEVARDAAMSYSSSHPATSEMYWRFYESGKGARIQAMRDAIESKYKSDNLDIKVSVDRSLMNRTITIRVDDQRYESFFMPIKIFGYAKVTIEDTVEMIRTVDFVRDMAVNIPKAGETLNKFEEKRKALAKKIDQFYSN